MKKSLQDVVNNKRRLEFDREMNLYPISLDPLTIHSSQPRRFQIVRNTVYRFNHSGPSYLIYKRRKSLVDRLLEQFYLFINHFGVQSHLFLIIMLFFFSALMRCILAAYILQPTLCAPLWFPHWQIWWPRDDPLTLSTPFGTVKGANVGSNVIRFTLPFAQPPLGALRFANPQPIKTFNGHDATQLPFACYQGNGGVGGNGPSEDCLYSTFYIPNSARSSTNRLPIMVWYHGGSGIVGSASQDGLNAAEWASTQNVIVVVPQYRLGLFGWLSTANTLDEQQGGSPGATKVAGNQAIRDVLFALQQIPTLADAMGGDASRVTIMGQSSGATMMRALLTTPSAQTLFNNAILVSDPMDYGLSSKDDNNFLGNLGMQSLNCTDLACARNKSANDILTATNTAYTDGPHQNQRISGGTPWRAMVGALITSSIATTTHIQKDVIMTTVRNEMGPTTGDYFSYQPAGAMTLSFQGSNLSLGQAEDLVFNQNRGLVAANMSIYQVNRTLNDGIRIMFEELSTDGVWRCAVQNNAYTMSSSGSKIWLAQWDLGATYISNQHNSYCTTDDRVCHEDDIEMIFGTVPNPTAQQKSASAEMQTRYSNFAKQGFPNAPNAASWQPVSSETQLNMLLVNHDGTTNIQQAQHAPACASNAWGSKVKFDYQLYTV